MLQKTRRLCNGSGTAVVAAPAVGGRRCTRSPLSVFMVGTAPDLRLTLGLL